MKNSRIPLFIFALLCLGSVPNYAQFATALFGAPLGCSDTSGSGTAQTCTTSPEIVPQPGFWVTYVTTTTNTGDVTATINTQAGHIRKWSSASVLAAGDLVANVPVTLMWDGTYWEISVIGNAPSGSGGSPGGSPTQLQYNSASAFGGMSQFTYSSPTLTVGSGGVLNIAAGTLDLPASAAYAPTSAEVFGYDSTNNRAVLGNGTNTSYFPWFTATPTANSVPTFSGTLGLVQSSSITDNGSVVKSSEGFSIGTTTHGVVISENGGVAVATALGGLNFPLVGQGSADPTWSPVAYPSVVASGGVIYAVSSTLLSSSFALTANSPVLGGGPAGAPFTAAGFTSDGISKLTLGASGTGGGLALFPSSGNFTTTLNSAATASNTVKFFAAVPTNLDRFYCAVSSTTCTLTDAGYAYNAIPNADLANSAITIAGTSVSLGGSTTSLPSPGVIGGTTPAAGSFTTLTGSTFNSTTKCAAVGSAASPSVASCSAAPTGSFSCATNASGATCVVDTSAVTANSAIFVQPDSSLGTLLSVTCNTTADTALTAPRVSARSAGTSFTLTLGTFSSNPLCFSYFLVN